MRENARGLATRALHGEGRREAERWPRSHVPPLYQSSAFTFPDARSGQAAFEGSGDFIYTRKDNPTVRALEERIAALEATPVPGRPAPEETLACCFFATGMAAISAVALSVAGGGGKVVAQEGIYGTSEHLLRGLDRFGIEVDFAPAGDTGALQRALRRGRPPALVHVETPANPRLQVTPIAETARLAHAVGAVLVVDGTFATPALQRPLSWGADFSLHSTTKFISGHGAALGGAVTAPRERVEAVLRPARRDLGGAPDPFAAWLTLLGLQTLPLRAERQSANADALARLLRGHPRVAAVHHPDPASLPPGQMAAGGPMLSFELEGGEVAALGTMDRLRVATLAATLGTLDTLVQHPWSMSHAILPEKRRRALGIGPGLLRVSVGLEDETDLLEDFERALSG